MLQRFFWPQQHLTLARREVCQIAMAAVESVQQGEVAAAGVQQGEVAAEGVQQGGVEETRVRTAIEDMLKDADMSSTSVYSFRRAVSRHMGLGKKGLEQQAEAVNKWIGEAVIAKAATTEAPQAPAARMQALLEDLGEPDTTYKGLVHFITLSRVLPETLASTDLRDVTGMSRLEILKMAREAFDDPLQAPGRAGRPCARPYCIVKKLIVFREAHEDGTVHFHVAVLLSQPRTFASAKYTLRHRDQVAAHFSTSHTEFWSTVRYGHIPTLKKPVVDSAPEKWSADGEEMDLFEEAQRPFMAAAWKRRREEVEKEENLGSSKKKRRFNKLDLTALVLAKKLNTRARLLEYVQDKGTEEMMVFVSQNQRKLNDFLADAEEWGAAREQAQRDRETDWAILCRAADQPCCHGDDCAYCKAANRIFEKNAATLNKEELAAALRNIIINGPSKATRVPIIVGPTNTGKSTLLIPIDLLFGFKNVFHRPALDSKFALRNLLKNKRFRGA